MDLLASLLVGRPGNILIVCAAFFVACLLSRSGAPANRRRAGPLAVASLAWGGYAAWEWFVQVRTPEANIRVDLLVIWPVLAVLSAWALYRALRSH